MIGSGFQKPIAVDLTTAMGHEATVFFDNASSLGRHGRPDENAQAVLYLASDRSSVTKEGLLVADGGLSA